MYSNWCVLWNQCVYSLTIYSPYLFFHFNLMFKNGQFNWSIGSTNEISKLLFDNWLSILGHNFPVFGNWIPFIVQLTISKIHWLTPWNIYAVDLFHFISVQFVIGSIYVSARFTFLWTSQLFVPLQSALKIHWVDLKNVSQASNKRTTKPHFLKIGTQKCLHWWNTLLKTLEKKIN